VVVAQKAQRSTGEVTVITFGTFDLFHYGHLRLLERARALGTRLVVGVSTDAFSFSKKKRYPVFPEDERMAILRGLRCVDDVFPEESMEKKRDYIIEHKADILVMGDDWKGRFDEFASVCKVHYLSRTENISSTEIETYIQSRGAKRPKDPRAPA
jgi:glycerol-3-phosphate cytidylyltransferase